MTEENDKGHYHYCPHDHDDDTDKFVRVPRGDIDFPKGEDIGFSHCEFCQEDIFPMASGDFCPDKLAKAKLKQYGYCEMPTQEQIQEDFEIHQL